MNVLSLFDGMSCGKLALDKAGVTYDNYYASEIDPYALQVSSKNHPDIQQIGDVQNIQPQYLPKIDLLIGGSPCQGFSKAGKGLAFDDPRSALFFNFVKIMKETKPRFFLLENVKMKKEWLDIITEYMGVHPVLINSNAVSPQNRQRYYWTNIPNVGHPPMTNTQTLGDILEDNPPDNYNPGAALLAKHDGGDYLNPEYRGQSNKIHDIYQKAPCLCAGSKGYNYGFVRQEDRLRRLTPLEFERLQTLPDNYTEGVSDTQRYKMCGNAVTVNVVAEIAKRIKLML